MLSGEGALLVETSNDPETLVSAVKQEVRAVDKDVALLGSLFGSSVTGASTPRCMRLLRDAIASAIMINTKARMSIVPSMRFSHSMAPELFLSAIVMVIDSADGEGFGEAWVVETQGDNQLLAIGRELIGLSQLSTLTRFPLRDDLFALPARLHSGNLSGGRLLFNLATVGVEHANATVVIGDPQLRLVISNHDLLRGRKYFLHSLLGITTALIAAAGVASPAAGTPPLLAIASCIF